MHLSAFNLYVEQFPGPDDVLVHNTFSGAYVAMERDTLALLRRVEQGHVLSPAERAGLDIETWLDPDVGIVVASLDQEADDYRAWFEVHRTQRALKCIVAINLACNFDCTYCCQAEVMDGTVMKPGVVTQTADWLASRAVAMDADRAHITFVGGEPLLHPDRIKTMAARIRARLDPHGVDLGLGLISNGYFLTPEMVQELLPYGLEMAQITLDGDHTTHRLSRVSKQGEDTFQRIFDNLVAASRHILITVNGNYQDSTLHGFGPLVDRLAAAGLPEKNPIHFTPALQILSAPEGSAAGTCAWSDTPHGIRVALHDRILGKGFAPDRLNALGPCGFHDHNLFAIDPQGTIFKCPGFLGHVGWRIGDVASGLDPAYRDMLAWDTSDACGGCAHRPNCAGGCVADAFLRTGEMNINCEIDYLDAVTPHALTREYLLATSTDREQAMTSFPRPPAALPEPRQPDTPPRGIRPDSLRVI